MSFRDKGRKMSATIADDLREYAVHRWPTANHKFRKARLAGLLGFTERRVRSFWESSPFMSPRDEEVAAIKALIGQQEEADATEDKAIAARLVALESQVAVLVAALARAELAANSYAARRGGDEASSHRSSVHSRRAADRH